MKTKLALLRLILLIFAGTSIAQVNSGPTPFASLGGGPFDVVNLGDLNVNFSIPILHKAGRGLNFGYDLTYNSSIWYPAGQSGNQSWQLVSSSVVPGWTGLGGPAFISYQLTYSSGQCYDGSQFAYYNTWGYGGFTYHDEFGVQHSYQVGWGYIQNNGPGRCGPSTGYSPSSATQTPRGSVLRLNSYAQTPRKCRSTGRPAQASFSLIGFRLFAQRSGTADWMWCQFGNALAGCPATWRREGFAGTLLSRSPFKAEPSSTKRLGPFALARADGAWLSNQSVDHRSHCRSDPT